MEGLGGEDVLATAMSAISLAAEKVSKTDLVSRIAQMQATIDSLSIKNQKLEEDIDTLVQEKEKMSEELSMKTEDNGVMEDRIAELESQNTELLVKTGIIDPGDTDLNSSGFQDPPPTPDPGSENNDKLRIPGWRIKYICDRIATGERPTICNIMYINMYSNENRFIGSSRFCEKIIKAHKTMCLRFAGEMGIPANPDDIASDIDGVKRSLKDFATMKERDFITKMFCSS
jgi:hypothetical protein